MTAPDTTIGALRPAETGILRFDGVERAVHWLTATLFFVLLLTGAALYAGPISLLVGRRDVVRTVHVVAGLALPVPVIVGMLGRAGRRLRADLRRLGRWDDGDSAWMRRRTRAAARVGKFNAGQKLNASFLGAAGIVMLGTGSIMKWFEPFPLEWRTGATFVHDWLALGIWLAVAGHVFFALRDPVARYGMRHGTVTARWARTNRPRWYEDETGRAADRLKRPVEPPESPSSSQRLPGS